MSTVTFTVSFPTDGGFIGRRCPSAACGRYFKVHQESLPASLHCPYCGESAETSELLTDEQQTHARRQVEEHAREYMCAQMDKVFSDLARRTSGNKYVSIRHIPIRYRAKPVTPSYSELAVDSELSCPECNVRFQVYGVFGFCPGCRTENQLIYDANLAILRRELSAKPADNRSLRHAYSDLVSMFETYCRNAASNEHHGANFQDLFESRGHFKRELAVDIFKDLSEIEIRSLRRVFNKRHVHQHNGGVVTERYVKKVPEDGDLLGKVAPLSIGEFEDGAKALRKVIDTLLSARRALGLSGPSSP